MKKWWLLVGVVVVIFTVIAWRLKGAIVGVGYTIQANGVVKVVDQSILASMVEQIRSAGAVRATYIYVKPGVDVQEEYVGSTPSIEKPIVAISGCRKPVKILGVAAIMQVDIDREWVEQVWGADAGARINGLLTQCLVFSMSGGNKEVFAKAVENIRPILQTGVAFGVGR